MQTAYLQNIQLTHRRVTTSIGIINDPGHDEPWFIAMSDKPGYLTNSRLRRALGIEPMFSDYKSRGFGHGTDANCRHRIGCPAYCW